MNAKRNIVFTETQKGAQTYDLMPPYSNVCINHIYNNLFKDKKQIIADIGSGTGRLSSQILHNNIVYGIEPDSMMRIVAEDKFNNFPNFHSIIGTAEDTSLSSNSIDFITVGQAFHRFDLQKFRKEADRILKNRDNVIILWNRIYYDIPIFNDLLLAIKNSYSAYKSRFVCSDEIQGSLLEIEENDKIAFEFYHNTSNVSKLTFENPFELSESNFYELCLSLWIFPLCNGQESQRILTSDEFNLPKFKQDISNIFKLYQKNGKITLPLKTDIYFH